MFTYTSYNPRISGCPCIGQSNNRNWHKIGILSGAYKVRVTMKKDHTLSGIRRAEKRAAQIHQYNMFNAGQYSDKAQS